MNIDQLKSVYLLGIGGIGMSALARYFMSRGVKISGYDKTSTPLTDQLIKEGMNIHFEENIDLIPDEIDLVVYTPAIPHGHKEMDYLIQKKLPLKKRAEVLGMISDKGKTIAVAGTHGKTTTATLIAHILNIAGTDMMAFLGGISKNYGTNFISSSAHQPIGSSTNVVVEADEFDKSFLKLHPSVAVITSADADHMDIYGSISDMKNTYREFTGKLKPGGDLILKNRVDIGSLKDTEIHVFSYDVEDEADYYATHLKVNNGTYFFDLHTPAGIISGLTVGIPGRFNLENAIAALSVAHRVGISEEVMRDSLKSYRGVQRRFDFHCRRPGFVYMDDYAHHPEELKACIRAVKEVFPGKKITGVFQPHLFSRTRDFADAFARSLELLDEIILLEIYPARETPVEGIDSAMLLNKIRSTNKTLCKKENLVEELILRDPEVLLTLGAGDIDQLVSPIVEAFENKRQ
jgi:UDP-N-acetylmuramate--alanine ligase